jgi:cobalt-zinc-cadmium efflux system outer membrane protein
MNLKSPFIQSCGVTLVAGLLAGCASNPNPAFEKVQATVRERTGKAVQWNRGSPEDAQVEQSVDAILKNELTVDSAVQLALLNNRTLQAEFEEVGISQAELVQAGLLKNPEFAASWRFPNRPPSGTDAEYSVAQDFLDLVFLPMRKKIAARQLEQTELRVTDAVLRLATETKKAFHTLQARQQLLKRLQLIVEANEAAAELSARQHEAGNINDLDLANQQSIYGQSRIDAAQTQAQSQSDREKLNRLMGLWGTRTAWKIADALPAIPAQELTLEHVESLAISNRLDLQVARLRSDVVGRALGLRKNFRYLPATARIGVDTERMQDGQRVTGPTLGLELPIFDQGQGEIGRLQAQYRQAHRQTEALAIDIRSEVREAANQLLASRDLAQYFGQVLLPQRTRIVTLTQQHYNAMLKGVYELLLAKQNELFTERAYVEAWRDYWIARAELERAVGGGFVLKPNQPATSDQNEHAHHH